MNFLLIGSMAVGIWACLAIIGNERQRRIQQIESREAQTRRQAQILAAKAREVPVVG